MRRTVLFALAALAVVRAAPSTAQQPASPRPGPVARVIRASLRGIQLTDAEKTGVKSVRTEFAPRFQALAKGAQPIRKQLRAARQAHDTATARSLMKQVRQNRRAGVALLRQSLVELRPKLAPEHQPRFDANLRRVRRMIRTRFGPG
ncbi:MAG TPA: hypothetical protein VHB25_07050 [Gemmatimonadaceae bacterium]|nr:hypothetical protein [Gemmatimonadaceae bacterium]